MNVPKPPSGDRPIKTLERVISKAGLGSRSEARKWIAAGRVRVNGAEVRDPDQWIDLERDQVLFDGKALQKEPPVYLLLHKPVGYLTTYDDKERRPTVYDLLADRSRFLTYVGRLDADTSGLLLMTNDTAFAERLTNPDYKVPKTYRVTASQVLDDGQLDQLRRGVELKDGMTRPAVVTRRDGAAFELTITEGRNRQIRRMVEAIGAEVVELARIAIGDLRIGELEKGKTRALTEAEVQALDGRVKSEG
jgi:23S rRNA pseudouridine2605 synthase